MTLTSAAEQARLRDQANFGLLTMFTLVPSLLMTIQTFWDHLSLPAARLFFIVHCCISPILFIDVIGSKFVILNVYLLLVGNLWIMTLH